ncbi:helix-turn-helix domain-containing protein [Roseomonas marmotae]|uniref:Helix-turn-helix transcriptional regulator n=1 Tax=Roseomonas marmotae TaxID=2768161 RepID=A0ABS3KH13_9PROT|nr:helix-turn-helix transcriptional regulator [Roseomonas marmotae]MBO1076762.1 helix-turn-helix transcriptional regulator [Roseomonas marmotae]QTI78710.1 helix-turn-helix transcriptional regulator [Roseomonas marmotae]
MRKRGPTTSDSAVGREIRQYRRSAGLTQKQVASMIGVTGAQLHRYETGSTRITASRLIAIANALGVRPDTLLAAASSPQETTVEQNNNLALPSSPSQEIVELIQMFGSIADPRHRSALVAVARMMTSPQVQRSVPEEGI